ncbi:MAG: hypothetical protein KKA73_01585 [Chloroflexi bacterium]|nr:hypothetical protein [Chloroflexota bacterium]MBU1746356.1 hypothetical protein [Chloroflexota bacterium]
MLFRTVYGPELAAIHVFIAEGPATREAIHAMFVPDDGSTQNVDDALTFLLSARLIEGEKVYQAIGGDGLPFRLQALRALRRLELGDEVPLHAVDPLFTLLLAELFIQPDRLFVQDVHQAANSLRAVKEAGGLSREKTQAWKRVIEFLRVGRRIAGGFQCVYTPSLLSNILATWSEDQGTLQAFFEEHLAQFLPHQTVDGRLAQAVAAPLEYMVEQGQVELFALQDSPSKPYFGDRRWRGIRRQP